jgi:hypothetical protein
MSFLRSVSASLAASSSHCRSRLATLPLISACLRADSLSSFSRSRSAPPSGRQGEGVRAAGPPGAGGGALTGDACTALRAVACAASSCSVLTCGREGPG